MDYLRNEPMARLVLEATIVLGLLGLMTSLCIMAVARYVIRKAEGAALAEHSDLVSLSQ